MELTQIISELENYNNGKFPRIALEQAIEKQEEITPLLLKNLEEWKDNLEELLELPDYFLHIYSLFLLAQFKETRAYPIIIEFFSAPGDITLDVTGDLVTEHLGRILASVSDGNIEPVKVLIENPQINEFVRGAALNSLMVLVAQGVISREFIIEYFEQLFSTKLEKEFSEEEEPSYIWADLVINSARLYPEELKQHIDQVFEADLIDPFFVNQEDIDYYLKLGKDATLKELNRDSHYCFIEDTIAEMEWWACFQPKTSVTRKPKAIGLEKFSFSSPKKSNQSKKKNKKKMQKQSRRKNRSKKR